MQGALHALIRTHIPEMVEEIRKVPKKIFPRKTLAIHTETQEGWGGKQRKGTVMKGHQAGGLRLCHGSHGKEDCGQGRGRVSSGVGGQERGWEEGPGQKVGICTLI